jgi:calcineurin-like phosphoesterase family protein
MERVYFIQHKGKKILIIDGSNCTVEEAPATLAKAREVIRSQPEKSVYTLTDLTNARFDDKIALDMKETIAGNKPYVYAAAVVGVTGLKQIFLNSVIKLTGRKLALFNTVEQAKDWLAEQ